LDETWFDSHDSAKTGWTDNSRRCVVGIPPSKGQCIIILHVGSSDDFVNGALHLTARNIKHTKADSHQEMNAKVFQGWFERTLLPKLPPRSVTVIDNAPYHSEQWEKIPNKGSTKSTIQIFSEKHNLYYQDSYTKKKLYSLFFSPWVGIEPATLASLSRNGIP
jgi:hypothetical protein